MKQLYLLFIALFVLAIQCKNLREMSSTRLTTTIMNPPKDSPTTLYSLLDSYRENNANLYADLITSDLTTNNLYGMAEKEVTYILQHNSFGQHTNFKVNSEKFSAYSEVICMLAENHDGKAYEAAYNLWMTDDEIVKDIQNEYDFADSNCQGYGNGWICVLLFSKQ